MSILTNFLYSIDGKINSYLGLSKPIYVPLYTEIIDDEVFLYSRIKNKRHIIKENIKDVSIEDNYSLEDQRKIISAVSNLMFAGLHCKKHDDVVKMEYHNE